MMHPAPRERSVRLAIRLIYGTGLLLPAILGLVARTLLVAEGEQPVPWSEGIRWMSVIAVFFFIPFVVLARLARVILSRHLQGGHHAQFQKWWHLAIGAWVGTAASLGGALLHQLHVPRFIEGVAMLIVMAPIGIPIMLAYVSFWAALGYLGGGCLGWIVWAARRRADILHNQAV